MASEPPHLLFDLPPELLLRVSKHLPDADVASLALCNHALLSFFSEAHKILALPDKDYQPRVSIWDDAPYERVEQRNLFLNRLSRDFPEFYLCFSCKKLYRAQGVTLPHARIPASDHQNHIFHCSQSEETWMNILDPFDQYEEENSMSDPCFRIHFFHVQLAMRGLRYGPQFGIPVEAFSTTKVKTRPRLYFEGDSEQISTLLEEREEEDTREDTGEEGGGEEGGGETVEQNRGGTEEDEAEFQRLYQTVLFSLDARAESNPPNLYVRNQCLLVIQKKNIPFWVDDEVEQIELGNDQCGCRKAGKDHAFRPFIESLAKRYLDDTSKTPQQEGHCRNCGKSWLIKIRSINEHEACFNLTQWRNLGPGLSPDDHMWLMHVGLGYTGYFSMENDRKCGPRRKFEECLVPAEGSNALSEEQLFDRNISLLDKQRYRTVMTKFSNPLWTRRETWREVPAQSEMQQPSDPAVP